MALSLDDIAFLRSERGLQALAAYAECDTSERNTLPLLTAMRKSLAPAEASATLATLRLRKRAAAKFPRFASDMLFTAAGLEQASHPMTRRYRAGLIESDSVLDICCGIGGDSLALAAAGKQVLGLDIDPVRIAIARHNADAMRLGATFRAANAARPLPQGFDCIFFDPGRRDAQGRRIRHVERYLPPLSLIRGWQAAEIIVKLSPAVDLRQLAPYGGQVEFISAKGQLIEAVHWLHRPPAPPRATLLTDDGARHLDRGSRPDIAITAPRAWLFEPDPAVLRAGLVQDLAHELDAAMIDETIAYLTMDTRVETPWGRYWKILDWMPFQLKRLRRYLIERGVGRVTVKKRGFAMAPEELVARLRLRAGDEARVLVMTRCRGKPVAIVCAPTQFG
ncbi:MAG: class I SAM-dependent methyltransferase [Chloroflexi bacterium]|nr:class I SAM-dependent methyltransferase [Chloroflexota bacterium]